MLPALAGMVPSRMTSSGRSWTCSPRSRGWSPPARPPRRRGDVLPALAGMVPTTRGSCAGPRRAPRARGDGPPIDWDKPIEPLCSPRSRGWSRDLRPRGGAGTVLPALAGMVPPSAESSTERSRAPRARGDGPQPAPSHPHDTMCSPRSRGWSQVRQVVLRGAFALPAVAGMVPSAAPIRVARLACFLCLRGWPACHVGALRVCGDASSSVRYDWGAVRCVYPRLQ